MAIGSNRGAPGLDSKTTTQHTQDVDFEADAISSYKEEEERSEWSIGKTEDHTVVVSSTQFNSVQSLSRVQLFATPWIAARPASLSITNSRSLLRLKSIESVMPSSHLIFCRPLLLLPRVLLADCFWHPVFQEYSRNTGPCHVLILPLWLDFFDYPPYLLTLTPLCWSPCHSYSCTNYTQSSICSKQCFSNYPLDSVPVSFKSLFKYDLRVDYPNYPISAIDTLKFSNSVLLLSSIIFIGLQYITEFLWYSLHIFALHPSESKSFYKGKTFDYFYCVFSVAVKVTQPVSDSLWSHGL